MHRRGFRTSHRRCATSQRVAGPHAAHAVSLNTLCMLWASPWCCVVGCDYTSYKGTNIQGQRESFQSIKDFGHPPDDAAILAHVLAHVHLLEPNLRPRDR